MQHTHTTSEIASIACLHDFSGPALLSCSKILTYQLLGSQLWTALPLEKSRSPATVNKVSKPRHNSRTKLCTELSLVHNRDNIEFYLHCKFQSLPSSVRRYNGVTDRTTDRQTDNAITVCLVAPPHRGIMKHLRCRCLGGMTLYPQTQLSTIPQTQQLQMHAYRISVQQSQFSALVMQSEANQC